MSRRRLSAGKLRRWLRGDIDLARLLDLSADDRDLILWQAHQSLHAGHVDEARRLFHLLGQLSTQSQAIVLLGDGVCAQAQGRLDEAEATYDRVLALEPVNPYALANRAEVRLLMGRVDPALDDLCIASQQAHLPAALRDRISRLQQIAQARLLDAKSSSPAPANSPSS